MVLYHDFPEAHQLVGLVVLFVHCLQRPVYPARGSPRFSVPVRNQDVEGFLYQCSNLIVTLGKGFKATDKGEVES